MRQCLSLLVACVLLCACAGDTTVPVPQPDDLVLGRIAAIRPAAGESASAELEIHVGLPESMKTSMKQEGRAIPQLPPDVDVRVKVTADTVCVARLRADDLESFRVGQEVAVRPVPGSTAMVGSKHLQVEAAELYLFSAYQLRFLPRSLQAPPPELSAPADPKRINSAGLESTPIPLQGGRVIYFAAGLIPAALGGPGSPAYGAVRPGMQAKDGTLAPWCLGGLRPYRVEWGMSGWEAPLPVELPGLDGTTSVRITWVDETETSCLVEVTDSVRHRLLASLRPNATARWGSLEPVALVTGSDVGDGQRFGAQKKSLVWTVSDATGSDLWLSIEGKVGQRLEPRINTVGHEYAPRVGRKTTLYFCRGDRQLLFAEGVIQEVRLAGGQRRPLLDACPTADAGRLFFRVPRYTPGQLDWDLAVASGSGANWGAPVLLDDWKPI
jgi:hypothetical protein